MARNKDVIWNCGELPHVDRDQAQLATLMDIRDELKRLNTLLHCFNFTSIPRKLDRISYNTAKPRKRKRK